MKLGIIQPYFFPNLGHFALIDATDQWVVFDITQYTPKTWMNRNRVLHPAEGWNYISVPLVKSSTSLLTHQAEVKDLKATEISVLGKLSHYKKTAPYYRQVCQLVINTFKQSTDNRLVSLNVSALLRVCDYLNIPLQLHICSELNLRFSDNMAAGDWAPSIAQQLGASTYINPWGGRDLFNEKTFTAVGVGLQLLQFDAPEYATPGYQFEPHLSILDTLMWVPPEQVETYLESQRQLVNLRGENP